MTHGMTPNDTRQLFRLRHLLRNEGAHCEVLACCLAQPEMRAVFARIAEAKDALGACLATLSPAPSPSQPPAVGADATSPSAHPTRRIYARIYALWLARSRRAGRMVIDATEVAELERAEDRLLKQFDSVLRNPQSTALRDALKRYLPQIQSCHAELRRLLASIAGNQQFSAGSIGGNRPATDFQIRRFQ